MKKEKRITPIRLAIRKAEFKKVISYDRSRAKTTTL